MKEYDMGAGVKLRGTVSASPRMREAYRMMREDGRSRKEVAEHFKVEPYLISQWCSRVEEALHDERVAQKAAS